MNRPRIRYAVHPWIHPEDAAAAVFARLRARQKRRQVDDHVIVEDLFIADLANRRPWSEEQILQIQESSTDRNFCERFARALEQGKSPTFDQEDLLILINWRDLHLIPSAPKLLNGYPGLRDWSPKAVAALFTNSNMEQFLDTAWFTARRKRLGLKARRPYKVNDFPARVK
jgi:hypothetical protein